MRTIILVILLTCASLVSARASTSVISIQSDRVLNLRVFVNGKLYNSKPDCLVRISSQTGLYHLEIRAFHTVSHRWYTIEHDVRTERGLEYCFSINWDNTSGVKLQTRGRYPVYSRYYLNPSLYNKHQTS